MEQFPRLKHLISHEEPIRKLWEEKNAFESDAQPGKPKFMCTFPYPYMNGVLHLGHAFSLSKAEIAAGYMKLKGYNVLFPFGFHCTGMPICAAAKKLEEEIKKFGNPPIFPNEESKKSVETDKKVIQKKKKESKKASKHIYQWNIMLEMGIPQEKVANFVDPKYWLTYFPPICKEDLIKFGLKADFRRAFITTDMNPFYDAFVKWQFTQLEKNKKLDFGNRMSIFSPIDNQVCADHDRSTGEGVQPQEYTIVKQKLLSPFPKCLSCLENQSVFLASATLRPETMYGQTNCFVLPSGEYGAYRMKNLYNNQNEIFICSSRSALNMSYQNLTHVRGQPELIVSCFGRDLIGARIQAPLCSYSETTGVVTSVPSDAPDDFIALEGIIINYNVLDLKNNEKLRKEYNIELDWIKEAVPIISIPAAEEVCKKLKISSQKDQVKLAQAKDMVYLKGFYEGIMLIGPKEDGKFMKVSNAKPIVKEMLINSQQSTLYSEPENTVISRSGCECVSALTDQWFIKYGDDDPNGGFNNISWKKQVKEHVSNNLETYNNQAKNKYLDVIDWLHEWACSRSFGLGTKLPCDKQYVIESLSDSTIYMAYYTISHLLQSGVFDGSKGGPLNVSVENIQDINISNAIFDYIFLNENTLDKISSYVNIDVLKKCRSEFEYWYPMDLRVSGNHLTMCLYNHAAIWPSQQSTKWPKSFFTNGHLMINSEKMAKSTGNFMTLGQAMNRFGVDATRLTITDSGDSMEDANFDTATANAAILRLYNEEMWITEQWSNFNHLRTGPYTLFDKIFLNDINTRIIAADKAYKTMQFKDALIYSLYALTNDRDEYRLRERNSIHKDVFLRFLDVFLIIFSPICPFFCEFLWKHTKHEGLVINAEWPSVSNVDNILFQKGLYLQNLLRNIRLNHKSIINSNTKLIDKLSKKKDLNDEEKKKIEYLKKPLDSCAIIVGDKYEDWQVQTLEICKSFWDSGEKMYKDGFNNAINEMATNECKIQGTNKGKVMKRTMNYTREIQQEAVNSGNDAFNTSLSFNEADFIKEIYEFLNRELPLEITIINSDNKELLQNINFVQGKDAAKPGKPIFYFYRK